MSPNIPALRKDAQRIHARLERSLYRAAVYLVPLVVLALSLYALLAWRPFYPEAHGQALPLRIIADEDGRLTPREALLRLRDVDAVPYRDTRLAEHPFWFLFQVRDLTDGKQHPTLIDFPSRHGTTISCWDAQTQEAVGTASHDRSTGRLAPVKSGFALSLRGDGVDRQYLCRARFVGPARISAVQILEEELHHAERKFHRDAGLLDGGLIILALFVFITALINREPTYILFAVWLVLNLRMGALSAGWDTQWLGYEIPSAWLPKLRQLTTATYYFLTVTLFAALFKEEMPKAGYRGLLQASQWSCIPLLILSLVLPFSTYLPVLWVATAFTIAVLVFLLLRILIITHSTVAMWYVASIGVTLFASLYEVVAAALGIKELIGSVNSVTAALASSLLASLAIAAQMRQEHEARLQAQARLQHTYDAIPIGMFTVDLFGRFTSLNPALRKMLGARPINGASHTWQQHFGAACWHELLELVQHHADSEMEIRAPVDSTGQASERRYLVKAILSDEKIEGTLQDVTEKSLATDRLNFLADNDALTKVLNRRGLEKVYRLSLERVDRGRPMALAYLDLDRFKLINDLYGHNVGDEVLHQVCERIRDLLSAQMHLARVGGDEFVILLPNTHLPLATVICRGIVDSIDHKPFRVGEKAFHVRGSIGLISVNPGTSLKDALTTSDRACREAKGGQQRGLVVFEQDAPAFKEHQAQLQLIGEISAGDSIPGLSIEMQPIMSLSQPHRALNFEVLLRMHDAAGQPVPVGRLIAAAEDCGRMSMIDRWVLTTTLAWLDQHRARLQRTQFVAINLSGASLNDEEFMHEVFDILRRNSHVSSFLTIEITESVALHDLKNTRRFIDRVRGYGARVALDDFGAGYTSFSYLKELPADLLKIDGSFVVRVNEHPANVSIVEAIVNLARNLGMKTIAEWAEDAATVQTLAEIGVDYVQGYAVARPMAPEQLLEGTSAASFVKDPVLAQFINAAARQSDPLAQLDLLMDPDKPSPPRVH